MCIGLQIYCSSELVPRFFLTNHGSFILIFFGKAPSPTALVEFITINEEDEGEELVKDLASFHIESASPEM